MEIDSPPAPSTSVEEERESLPLTVHVRQPLSVPRRREIPVQEDFGKATYALSRHRKNKVLVWQSKTLPGKVYEFVLATRFRIPGLFSWKCLHCSVLKQKLKKEGEPCFDKKIPLLLVDNDIIKEDPDRPNNGAHFCEGRDVVDATVLRTKLVFYDAFAKGNLSLDQQHEAVEMGATSVTPFNLTNVEKETVRSLFDDKAVENMNRVIRKRRIAMHTKGMKEEEEEELPPELDKSAEVEVASAAATSSTQPPPPPAVTRKLPIKRLVKLKDPTTSGQAPSRSSPMEVRKVVIQRMDAKKVIVQRDFRHVVHPPIIIRYRVPVIRSRFVPVSKLRAALPPSPPPYTPPEPCYGPEEEDIDGDEFIDVEGFDSS